MKIIELFKIVEGALVYTLTSGDTAETYLSEVYVPTTIGRSDAESKAELSRANNEITLSVDHPVAQRYLNSIIDAIVTLTIYTKQDASYLVTWKGRLAAVKPVNATVKLVFESVFTSLRRPGLRRHYQRNCPHVLYGRGCYVNMLAYEVSVSVVTINGNDVLLNGDGGNPDGWFTGGILKAPDNTLRFITAHSGNTIALIRPIPSLTVAGVVKLYPGCDRTRTVCQNKFNNLLNNGSTPFIPIKNPFGGLSFI